MAKKKQQPRPKHVPERTCIACRAHGAKRVLARVVRRPEGGVAVDETGKQKGRGAYLCRQRICWQQALKRGALTRALRAPLTAEEVAALQAYADTLPATLAPDGTEQHLSALPGDENGALLVDQQG